MINQNKSTGYCDMFGEEIYEGDIISCNENKQKLVVFDNQSNKFGVLVDTSNKEKFFMSFDSFPKRRFEHIRIVSLKSQKSA
jgi:ssDNA-binding Zn-finger/Zn-ribbon topoisomerase 1